MKSSCPTMETDERWTPRKSRRRLLGKRRGKHKKAKGDGLWVVSEVTHASEILRSLPFRQMLKRMGFSDYEHYLRSGLWANIRTLVFARSKACIRCEEPANQVHHSEYELSTMRGLTIDGLYPVCFDCHKSAEFIDGAKATLEQANSFLGVHSSEPRATRSSPSADRPVKAASTVKGTKMQTASTPPVRRSRTG